MSSRRPPSKIEPGPLRSLPWALYTSRPYNSCAEAPPSSPVPAGQLIAVGQPEPHRPRILPGRVVEFSMRDFDVVAVSHVNVLPGSQAGDPKDADITAAVEAHTHGHGDDGNALVVVVADGQGSANPSAGSDIELLGPVLLGGFSGNGN